MSRGGAGPGAAIRAVIFDRDGVLAWFDLAAAAAFFRPLLPISVEEISRRWIEWNARAGALRDVSQERAYLTAFWNGVADDLGLAPATRARLHAFDYTAILHPYADARPALQAAKAHGLRVGVLSNFSLASLDASLIATGLGEWVDAAWAARAGGAAKPHRAAYLAMANALGVAPHECLLFDDEVACVAGARELGMRAYLVDRHHKHPLPATGVVPDLAALPRILAALTVGSGDPR